MFTMRREGDIFTERKEEGIFNGRGGGWVFRDRDDSNLFVMLSVKQLLHFEQQLRVTHLVQPI